MRAFIAIELPDEIRKRLVELQNELKKEFGDSIKFVEPENLHITLRFFPELDERDISEVKKIIANTDMGPFTARCVGLGAFPNENFIRVIWIGVDSNGKIESIEDKISKQLEKIGFKREANRFVSHITLGRVKEKIKFKEQLKKYSAFDFGSFNVYMKDIKLKRSQLTPKGPIYADL
ncbi:MAG: RNA 2',3'-cyclic phosphodiesterase [Candidatus Micrarchaeota archaeon]|nr:RNA 2',3'-cyclic phosphodiesterase [Candidatus Micrarchaeota archaeon]